MDIKCLPIYKACLEKYAITKIKPDANINVVHSTKAIELIPVFSSSGVHMQDVSHKYFFVHNMRRWPNVGSQLEQRLRRWASCKLTLRQRVMPVGQVTYLAQSDKYDNWAKIQASTRRWPDVVSMLVHRLRRWPNIETTSGQRIVHA